VLSTLHMAVSQKKEVVPVKNHNMVKFRALFGEAS
jgi:hypothetical protein